MSTRPLPTPESPEDLGSEVVRVGAKDVAVAARHWVEPSGNSVIEIDALVGSSLVRHRMKVGAEDQPLPVGYTLAQLQADIATEKVKAAAMAAGHDRAVNLIRQLVIS
jgi:hypothetical protein